MKPILFNSEMVRAILDGRKTTTRRIIKPHYCNDEYGFNVWYNEETKRYVVEKYDEDERDFEQTRYINSPYEVGDVLYVRETWQCFNPYSDKEYVYKATNDCSDVINMKWHPSIHMPKEAARIFLKVTGVRAERLQALNNEDALKEGLLLPCHRENEDCSAYEHCAVDYKGGKGSCIEKFINLWDSTVKKSDLDRYGWNANPFVWIIEFERCDNPELLGGDAE